MSQTSPILSMPFLQPSQAQKHVTHNEALETLDVVVQLRATSFAETVPPVGPAEGEVFVPAPGAVADWAGHASDIAVWRDGQWHFLEPQAGWRAWDLTAACLRVWDGAAWNEPEISTENLPGVGIGTVSDATNRLSVRGAATLLSHDGAGHQVKVNKAAAGDTASLLFQSDWTGHAEMGLAGGTDFSVKVSGDGSAWTNGLVVKASSGDTGFGPADPQARVHAQSAGTQPVLRADATATGFAGDVLAVQSTRSASAAFAFARFSSSAGGDTAFVLSGDGNAACDGSWTGGGADYAEYFEWADGNAGAEDRRGMSVVLEGDRIRPAQPGEEPIGVVSGNPSVVGDGDIGHWKGKYLQDAFGGYVLEPCERVEWSDDGGAHSYPADAVPSDVVVPPDAVYRPDTRRCLNPDFVDHARYVPRSDRPEWDMVGLVGKLRLRTGQPTGARWVRMRQVSAEVEEWLVR